MSSKTDLLNPILHHTHYGKIPFRNKYRSIHQQYSIRLFFFCCGLKLLEEKHEIYQKWHSSDKFGQFEIVVLIFLHKILLKFLLIVR